MANTNIFLNYTSTQMLHTNKTAEGKTFVNVSIPVKASKTGYGSFGVSLGQVMPAVRKDGTQSEGYRNILLGKPEATRQVSICAKAAGKRSKAIYENITMTNAEILAAVTENRKEYRAAAKEEAEA